MTSRVSSNKLTDTSVEFAHTAEWLLECNAKSSSVVVKVEAKIENGADYVTIDEFVPNKRPINRYVAIPFIKVGWSGNGAGETITIWTA